MIESALYAAVAPLVLLLLSSAWSYPPILEEVVKWGILKLGSSERVLRVRDGAIVGLVFGLCEAILFSLNAWSGGEWGTLVSRLVLTVPMHAVATSVTAWGVGRRVGLVGLGIAMVIHAIFNHVVTMF